MRHLVGISQERDSQLMANVEIAQVVEDCGVDAVENGRSRPLPAAIVGAWHGWRLFNPSLRISPS